MGTLDVMKKEISGLLRKESERIAEIQGVRSASARVDGFASVVRGVLSASSLCYIDGALRFFDGRAYSPVTMRELIIAVGNILSDMGVGASDVRKMGDMPFSVLWEKTYSGEPDLVCFRNCVYDIRTGKTAAFSPDARTGYSLPYAWSPDAECPKWNAFLEEVLPDRTERMCLQEFFGMCYVDRSRYSIEKMALLIGSGSNGKSVVFDVMKRVIGEEWVSFLSPEQLMDGKQLVSVAGKRLNFAPDIKKSSAFDSGLKALSSSQDVQGWRLYEGNVTVKCPPLVFAFNELPLFRDETDAFFRRLLPFRFDVVIPPERQNKRLASEICASELPGIFRWVMEGRARLLKQRGSFTKCDRIDDAVTSLRNRVRGEQYPVLTWLESKGFSVRPMYEGQEFVKVQQSVIFKGLGGRLSRDAITRELTSLGVARDRNTETRYFLYLAGGFSRPS